MKHSNDYIKNYVNAYLKEIESRSNDNFVPDIVQLNKFATIVAIFQQMADKYDGEVTIEQEPKQEHGWLSAKLRYFDLKSDMFADFGEVISSASAFGIEPAGDEFIVSVTIPNIYKRR